MRLLRHFVPRNDKGGGCNDSKGEGITFNMLNHPDNNMTP